jgi:hypothetical protein
MPGFLVTIGSRVHCTHLGTATPMIPNLRVLVSGQASVTIASKYVVAGCPFNVGGAYVPCVSGQWITGTTRILSNGQPLVVQAGQSACVPNGTPLVVLATQARVIGL